MSGLVMRGVNDDCSEAPYSIQSTSSVSTNLFRNAAAMVAYICVQAVE
jgi:hypothetical protein